MENKLKILIPSLCVLITLTIMFSAHMNDCNKDYFKLFRSKKTVHEDSFFIESLESFLVTSDIEETLFNNVNFIEIYENPEHYFEDARRTILSSSSNYRMKSMSLKSMFKLPASKYAVILNDVFTLYQNSKTEDNLNLLIESIHSPFGKQHISSFCYTNNKIRNVLFRISNEEDSLKDSINYILSGENKRSLKKFYFLQNI